MIGIFEVTYNKKNINMLSRGYIIGKIIDDITSLKSQLEIRSKLGQFDLNKFCEDFFREIINITYDVNLRNLNETRSNVAGIDLGDEEKKVAFQITSQKDSGKVNDTLKAITEEQLELYNELFIFIIGQKQGKYTIHEDNKDKKTKLKFDTTSNILDLDELLRKIVLLDGQKLDMLYGVFRQEFRQVKVEFEPVDDDGHFESSYYNNIEPIPSLPPQNSKKYLVDWVEINEDDLEQNHNDVVLLYNRLSLIPRVTREILAIIVERGKYEERLVPSRYRILPESLEKFLRASEKELIAEINILQNEYLVDLNESHMGDRTIYFIDIVDDTLNSLLFYLKENGISIRTVLNRMDFTVIDRD